MILHRGHWLLPVEGGDAWIGATHEPGVDDVNPTEVARASLLTSAQRLTDSKITPTAHMVGLRLAARDRRPVVGRHPDNSRLGILSALGSKGVLYAPWLARQWREHLQHNLPFDPSVSLTRDGATRAE